MNRSNIFLFDNITHLLNQQNILVTNTVLKFIHYGFKNQTPEINFRRIKSHLVERLKKYNIPYITLKHNDPLALEYDYIQNEIKTLTKNNLNQKTWIVLPIESFRSLVMTLNTQVGQEIRKYLEKHDLVKYTNEFATLMRTQSEFPLNIFDFINQNNYKFNLGTWFMDIWFPLFEQKNLIITNELLFFIHHGISVTDGHPSLNLRRYKEDLKKILDNYKIEYQIINYKNITKN